MTVGPALYSNLSYAPASSFAPVGLAVRNQMILVGRGDLPPNTLDELITYAKSNNLSIASVGAGSLYHLTIERFKRAIDVDLLRVPYKGGAPATVDLLGGQVDLMFNEGHLAVPHIAAGKLKAYAVAGESRHPSLPDVPTIEEVIGQPFNAVSWFGLLAPAKTPEAVINTLWEALQHASKNEKVQSTLREMGLTIDTNKPEEFQSLINDEHRALKRIAEEAIFRSNSSARFSG